MFTASITALRIRSPVVGVSNDCICTSSSFTTPPTPSLVIDRWTTPTAGLTEVATQNCTVSMRGVTSPGVGSPALLNEPVVEVVQGYVSIPGVTGVKPPAVLSYPAALRAIEQFRELAGRRGAGTAAGAAGLAAGWLIASPPCASPSQTHCTPGNSDHCRG